MKKFSILFISLAICLPIFSVAQVKKQAPDQDKFTSGELKKIEKSKSLYQKNKFSKAISMISGVQQTHLLNEELWTMRIAYEYENYQEAMYKDMLKAGKRTDFLIPPGLAAKIQLLAACEDATLYCENQEAAS
ncbi:MAG TPA: hypothetical protein VFJ43_11250, partial [Bacteroidia bacterium]|nr:hypothetical protein [Bacteroidia bacterium]